MQVLHCKQDLSLNKELALPPFAGVHYFILQSEIPAEKTASSSQLCYRKLLIAVGLHVTTA